MELLERDDHLAFLHERLADAEREAGQIVFLGGEAGTGKTSLIWRFADEIGERVTTAIGACDGLSTPQPLAPLIDIAEGIQGRSAGLIWSGAPRLQIFYSALEDLVAASGPLVVVIEDAHWADDATRDLIRFLGRRWRSLPVLLIVTFRCDETGPGHPLSTVLGELGAMSNVHRITLPPLSPEAVRHLAAGTNFDVEDLYCRTRGNPFFVAEVLAAGEPGIPQSLRDAVMARAARLPVPARRALERAAVLGCSFEKSLLTHVTGDEAEAIDTCLDAGMLVESGAQLRFQHELARQAVHEAIGPSRRAALHRQTLEIMTAGAAGVVAPDRMAYHAEEAGDRAAVIDYGTLAAERAAALGAHRDAGDQYGRVLRFADDLPLEARAELLERHSHEMYLVGQWQAAIDSRTKAVSIWRSQGDDRKQGESETLLGRVYWSSGASSTAEAALTRAFQLLEGNPPDALFLAALVFQTELAMLRGYQNEAAALGCRASDLADSLGDVASRIHIMISLGTGLLLQGSESGRLMIEECSGLARERGEDAAIDRGWVFLAATAIHRFDFHRAEPVLAEGIAWAREHDFDRTEQCLTALGALMNLHRSSWPAAESTTLELNSDTAEPGIEQCVSLAVLGRLRARTGAVGSGELLADACQLAAQSDNIFYLNTAFAAGAEGAWLAGDRERAIDLAFSVLPRAIDSGNEWWVGDLALILSQAGIENLPLDACAPPFRMQIEGDLTAAAAAWTDLGCRYQAAVALMDGDNASLCRAHRIFEDLGARPMLERTKRLIEERGVRTEDPVPTIADVADTPFGITPREREVLALLADGLSDRDIADNLYIGSGTVRSHLTSLFSKLGVKSRTAAIAAARRGGLL